MSSANHVPCTKILHNFFISVTYTLHSVFTIIIIIMYSYVVGVRLLIGSAVHSMLLVCQDCPSLRLLHNNQSEHFFIIVTFLSRVNVLWEVVAEKW